MKTFYNFIIESLTNFPEDEFTVYKNRVSIPYNYSSLIRQWLLKQKENIEDEFIVDAIDEIVLAYDNKDDDKTGIDFKYDKNTISVYTVDGIFVFTSPVNITIEKVKKIIGI